MPKITTDYSKTIMYKIVCNDLNVKECYVGHTINMTKRKYKHKSACNNENANAYNFKIYKIIRENGGWDNWTMLLVEEFPCKDKYQACKREREIFEELGAFMNTVRPYRTHEEHKEELKQNHKKYCEEHYQERKQYQKIYNKKYREENKEELKLYDKKYREKHKEELIEKHKEKVECEYCAKQLQKGNMPRHRKTCKSKPKEEK